MQTILIVDDHASGARMGAGGRSALVIIRSRMPDLTLLDLRTADMDGLSELDGTAEKGNEVGYKIRST